MSLSSTKEQVSLSLPLTHQKSRVRVRFPFAVTSSFFPSISCLPYGDYITFTSLL